MPHTPQTTQDGLIMLSTSRGTHPRTSGDAEAELSTAIPLDDVARAIKDIADGRPVVVVDDADRENEGDIVFAASKATPELLAFTVRYGRGVICVPMLGADLDRLNVPLMTSAEQEQHAHRLHGHRGRAARRHDGHLRGRPRDDHQRLADPRGRRRATSSGRATCSRSATREGGVLAGPATPRPPSTWPRSPGCRRRRGVRGVGDDGTMMRLPALREFADEHGLALISIEQLIEYRRRTERLVTRVAETVIPNAYGELACLRLPLRHRRRGAPRPRPR